MSLSNRVVSALKEEFQKKASGESLPATKTNKTVVIEGNDQTIDYSVSAFGVDQFSFSFEKIEFAGKPATSQEEPQDFRQKIDQTLDKINYLSEPLALIELEGGASTAQVRSASPFEFDDGLEYFELTVQAGVSLSFSRFSKKRNIAPRAPIPFILTEMITKRLIDDLAQILR